MQFKIVALVLAASMSVSIAQAKKSTPIPPTISASANVSIALQSEQLPPSVPLIDGSLNFQISHSFEISGAQEAALKEETTISLLGLEFTPGDDPKFSNGDKSCNVTKEIELGLVPGVDTVSASVKGKWNNGKMSLSVKISEKFKDVAPPLPLTAVSEAILSSPALKGAKPTVRVSPRIENVMQIYSTIEHPSIPPAEFVTFMAADVSQTQTEAATAEGVQIQEASQSIKTKLYTTPPMP